jgi:DNA repair protein RadC
MQADLIQFPQAEEMWAYELSAVFKPVASFEAIKGSNAGAAAEYLYALGMAERPQEHFIVLALNTKNVIVGHSVVSCGLVDRAPVAVRECFRPAILHNAAKVILAHNHPSGDVTPSSADIRTTQTLREAGELIGIEVVDHIVVGYDLTGHKRIYQSLRENGVFNTQKNVRAA